MAVEYVIELFDNGATFGPNVKLAEIWDARNVGWSWYDRVPAKAFCTLYQTSPLLSLLSPLLTHITMTRVASSGNKTLFSGVFLDYSSSGDDVVLDCFNYMSLLSLSRSGYRTMYPTKLIGTEVASPEWTAAKGATSSPLGFVTTGTIENPLGTDGVTPIKTSAQFGTLDQNRLQLFYDLSEIGRANTVNQATFEITRDNPTFNFWKNDGAFVDLGLVLNGNVSDYQYLPGWTRYRNDLATIGLNSAGGTGEIVKTDAAEITAKGRRQDVTTLKTLLGIVGAATEADQQQAALARELQAATKQPAVLAVSLVPGTLEPFTGWDINDWTGIEISNGIDALTGNRRIVGVRGLYDDTGEALDLFLEAKL